MKRLTRLGALPLKRSAYLLPAQDSTLEDFQWLRQEIRDDGGDAWIVAGRFVAGPHEQEIHDRFRTMRAQDYRLIAADARAFLERLHERSEPVEDRDAAEHQAEWRKLLRRVEVTRDIDFFHAPERDEVEALMAAIERDIVMDNKQPAKANTADEWRARTWVTRTGVKVDRMASAWLIRRFIDPAASFRFVAPESAAAVTDGVRFDMFEGEFTHDGNRCTFEVLLDVAARPQDGGLIALAEIVHDLDLRDDRYQRPETAGVQALLDGIIARFADDERRLAESAPLFDALYASLGGKALPVDGGKR